MALYPEAAPDGGPLLLRYGRDFLGWNGAGWRELTAVPPGILGVYGIACDAARGRTVVFGLTGFVPATVGTAEWDGETWTVFPSAAVGGPLVDLRYDPALGGVLALTQPVFGPGTQDHLWNGANWTPLPPNVRPRHVGAVLAADPARSRLVAFGTNPTTGTAETHEWNGTTWSLQSPANSPPPRQAPAMAFDPIAGEVLLFGGRTPSGTLQDGWYWDGTDWAPAAGAPPLPPVGDHPRLFLDRVRGALVLLDRYVGDRDFVRTAGGWSALSVEPYVGSMIVHDVLNSRLVKHDAPNTYSWDGNTWSRIATGGPSARSAPAAVDLGLSSLVVFGGRSSTLPQQVLGDTWTLTGTQWTQQVVGGAPPARAQHALVMHAATASVILFGGLDSSGAGLADTWRWQNGAWTNLSPALAVTPPAGDCTSASSLTADPAVVAGGQLWRWNGTWNMTTAVPSTGGAAAFWTRAIGFTPADRIVLTGSSLGVPQTYELVNSTWVLQAPQQVTLDALAKDPLRGNVVGFDGGEMYAFTATAAGNAQVGNGCGAPAPALYSEGFPRVGNLAHRIHADGLDGFVLFALDVAASTTPLGGGCALHLGNPVTAAIVIANPFGVASLPLPVPNAPWLNGVDLFVQAAGPQPGGPYLGLAVSAGLRVRLGE